jgi:hypothetical protein
VEKTIRLGERTAVRRGWLKKYSILFAGEPSPGVYSVVTEWTNAHNSAGYNIYFHKNQREFQVFGGRITIVNVTMDEMRFRFEK